MPNIKVKYIIDENGDRVAPITYIDAVRDSNGDGLGTILESKADSTDVSDLQDLIPTQASSSNQLADKEFVNSSVSTATATYRGCYNLVSDLSLTTQASHGLIETALASAISDTPDNNDYAFVQIPTDDSTPTEIASVERYKFNGTLWSFEYTLNNSGFTAAQWAALNSNITSGLVAKLNSLSTNTLSTIANLFGMDSNGNFLNITMANFASILGVEGNIQNVIKYYHFHSSIGWNNGSIRFKCPFKGYDGSADRILFIVFGTHCIYSCNIFNYTAAYQVVELSKVGGDSTTTSLTFESVNGQLYLTLTESWPSVYIPYCLFMPGGTHTSEFYNMNFELA